MCPVPEDRVNDMTQLAYIEDYNGIDVHKASGWESAPTVNSFDQDTVLDCDAFRKLPVLVITKGAIGLQHMLGDGRQTISLIFFDGDVVDFRHFGKASGKLVCMLPVSANLYKGDEFDQMQRSSTRFQIEQTSNQARQHLYAAQHSVDLARKSAIEKLASFIFECRKRQQLGRSLNICLRLRRTDIADYMGLRVETLSRAFSKLRQMKLILSNDADEIEILNEPALRQLANGKTVSNWVRHDEYPQT